MVVCRYFLQGNCRFGVNCRFEHNVPNYNSNSYIVQQQQQLPPYRQQQQRQLSSNEYRQQQHGQLSSNEFFELVQHDLELAERSNQWLLSCYCPYPSKSDALPGLVDHSPEELRYQMYEAQSTGNVQSCQQEIQKLYQDAQLKRKIFKSQSPECKAILERVRSGPASPSSSSNPFQTNNSVGSAFAGASVETKIFGGSTAPQASAFGGGNVLPAQTNPFGTATVPQASFSGGSAATNVNPFIGQSSFFGGAATPAPTNSLFGGAYNGQSSLFGGQSGVGASSVGNTNVFGKGSSAMNSFSFAAAAQDQGLISPPQAPPVPTQAMGSMFGGGAQPSVHAVAVPPAVAPAMAPAMAPAVTMAANPFGAPTQPMKTVAPQVEVGVHTSFNDLTEEEKAEFMAPTFSRGRIPLRPPPTQLCV